MISVSEIFNCLSGNNGLTEEEIYKNIASNDDKYMVLSSSTDLRTNMGMIPLIELNGKQISYFENRFGILVARNGKAGSMTLLNNNCKYTINDHAYILYLKEDFVNKNSFNEVDFLKWFIIKHQNTIRTYSTNNDNSTWNKTSFFSECKIGIPEPSNISSFSRLYDLVDNVKYFVFDFYNIINDSLSKIISVESNSLDNILLNNILKYISRNDCLSEEGLYNFEKTSSKDKIKVLSGSIDDIFYGLIPKLTEGIHFLNNRQGLHIVTRGKAGKLTYLPKGYYATNTNAFILYILDEIKNELGIFSEEDESYYIKFLKIYLEPIFLEISSNSDVGVFPLTKVFEDMEIPKFILNDEIKEIVDKYDKLYSIKETLEKDISYIESLLEKEVV